MGAPPVHRCSVLIVDDDAEAREVLALELSEIGYGVATVENGRQALDYLRSHADICIIAVDLLLPVMDGAKFRAAQLRDRSLAWIPVVVISGAPDGAERARQLGARAFVGKPLNLEEVRESLRRIGCCQSKSRTGRSRGETR